MTVFFDHARQRWRYDFQVKGVRHAGYANDPKTGEPAANVTEARHIEDALRVAARTVAGRPQPAKPYTLIRAIATYSPRKEGQADWANKKTYIAELARFFGRMTPLAEITEAEVWKYIEWARAQPVLIWAGGNKRQAKNHSKADGRFWRNTGRTRDDATINRYLAALREMLSIAGRARDPKTGEPLLKHMPLVPELKEPKRLPRPIPDGVLHRLSDTAPPHVAQGALLVRHMGFRKAEVFGLTLPQMDHTLQGIWLRAEDTKGGKDEFIPANAVAWGLLLELEASARAEGRDYLIAYRPKLTNGKLGPARPVKNPKRAFKTAMRAIGVQHRWHDTKASFVTQVARTASAATTRGLARHEDASTTDRYLGVVDEDRLQALDAIARSWLLASGEPRSPTQDLHTAPYKFSVLGDKPLGIMVGATGFEPATPSPPVSGTPENVLVFRRRRPPSEG